MIYNLYIKVEGNEQILLYQLKLKK